MKSCVILQLPQDENSMVHWWRYHIGTHANESDNISEQGSFTDISSMNALFVQDDEPLWALIPGSQVTTHVCHVPAKVKQQRDKLLPVLLEDKLAQDIESVHIVPLAQEGESVTCAVIAHDELQRYLRWLAQAGLQPARLLPDWLSLPCHPQGPHFACYGDVWLMRRGLWQGASLSLELLPVALKELMTAEESTVAVAETDSPSMNNHDTDPVRTGMEHTEHVAVQVMQTASIYSVHPFPSHLQSVGCQQSASNITKLELAMAQAYTATSANLLSGSYRPRLPCSESDKRYWRPLLFALLSLMLIVTGERWMVSQRLSNQIQLVHQQSVEHYQSLFSRPQRIVNVRQQLTALRKQMEAAQAPEFLPGLTQLAEVVAPISTQLMWSRLNYDRAQKVINIEVQSDDPAILQTLEKRLAVQFEAQSEMNSNTQYQAGAENRSSWSLREKKMVLPADKEQKKP